MNVMDFIFLSFTTLCFYLLSCSADQIHASSLSEDKVSIQLILKAMKDVQVQNKEFQIRMEMLETEISDLKATNKRLRDDISILKKKEDSKTERNYEFFRHKSDEKRLLMPEAESANSSMAVAFSVALTHVVTLGQDQLVEYDKVVTNIGNSFDPRHSHFIAPMDGIYLFSACGFSQPPHSTHLDIVKNGTPIGYLYTYNHDMGTQVIVVVLKKGDMVWVKHTSNPYDATGAAVLYGAKVEQFVTFSGALIRSL